MSQEPDGTFQVREAGLTIAASTSPGETRRACLRLAGELDMDASAALSKTVDWLAAVGPVSVLIDLAKVTFAGSTLPNFIVRLSAATPDAELILWRSSPVTKLILRITDMAAISTLRDDPVAPYGLPG